jgi:SAM-dependent methyltransferase
MSRQTIRKSIQSYDLSPHDTSLDGIDQARGYIDAGASTPDEVWIGGWMLHPDKAITALRVYLNDEFVGRVDLEPRPDVGQVFPWIPHATHSGFHVHLDKSKLGKMRSGHIDLVGCQGDQPVIRLSTLYRTDLDTAVPTPPADLMHRVTQTRDRQFFKLWGLKCYGDFLEFFRRHSDPARTRRLLDWGCGCGRLSVHFLADRSGPEVFGCDVDGEAVAWCNANLRAGRFTKIDSFPPTPYPDASFQLIAGYSIFTHLTKDVQFAWLAEMRRLLAPGGIFVATVHGESATSFMFPGKVASVLETGIYDGGHDEVLDGIVPQGYYRGTFQSQEYTVREWGKYFDILEYKVRGIGNHQDVVVMRRPT